MKYLPSPMAFVLAYVLLGMLFMPATGASAQAIKVTGASHKGDQLTLTLGQDTLLVRVCKANLLKVDYRPNGQFAPETHCMANTNWATVPAQFNLASDPMVITTSKMIVTISRAPCHIAVYDTSKHLLIQEQNVQGGPSSSLALTGMEDAHYFGLRGWSYLDHAGSQVELTPRNAPYDMRAGGEGNTGGPFLWSSKGYGVYVDTSGGQCTLSAPNSIVFSNLSKPNVEFYLMVGNAYTLHTLLDEFTGMPPMFPKWALGLFNSEFAGIHESDMRSIVAGYRARGIPFDTYVNDFDWKDWSGDNYGEWHWNPVKFPDGASGELKKDMDAIGIKMVGIMKPRIHVNTVQGRYATEHGFWVKKPFYKDYFDGGLVGDLDFSIPACRQWFWDHSEDAFNTGVVGWWNDEADAWSDNFAFMYMAQAEYEGQRQYTHNQNRVYTINRNFYPGSQRYAYATWSGDIDSGFGVMQDQRARLLASLNIGQEKWGMDTDGFNNNNHVYGQEANECYARWIEFDTFVPIFRLHGTSRRQPWLYGPVAQAAATKAIKLRYSLIPYLYAYDRTLTQSGIGICRPLVWDYPNDPQCLNDVDSWMFGKYLLVSPVVVQGQSVKQIYLPAGTWTDYFRGTVYQGAQTISYPVNSATWDDIPLFIKSGAIIPTIPVMNYIGEKPIKTVMLDIFPSAANTQFTYYDDDGITYDYEKGAYFSQVLTTRGDKSAVVLTIARKTGAYTPPLRAYLCKIHGHHASVVRVNGKAVQRYPETTDLVAFSGEGWATGKDIYGPVTWVKVTAGNAQKIVAEF
jgi:alpha-glucosidase